MDDFRFRVQERCKHLLKHLLANGQTVRWATQQPLLAGFLANCGAPRLSLDIGCGGGAYAFRLLAPISDKVICVEPNDRLRQLASKRTARRRLGHKVEVLPGHACAVPVPDEVADLVLLVEVLEHVADAEGALKEVRRVMKPSGRLLLSVPHPPEVVDNPDHLHKGFSTEEISDLLHRNGFEIDRIAYCMFSISRLVLRCAAFSPIPLPLTPLCRFEHATQRWMRWRNPYDTVILARKGPRNSDG
jgi:SAM-dependent methyltransferase